MVTPGAKRDAVAHARNCHGLSERRACHLIGIARRVARYEPRAADDTGLRQRLRELAAARRRFGYRRLGYLLAREGLKPNHKKLLRLYREEGLKLRRRGGRKRALGTRAPMALPQGPNQRWSLDFVSDAFGCGRRQRHGADIGLDPTLVAGAAGGMALHRAGQTDPECFRRKLQRTAA